MAITIHKKWQDAAEKWRVLISKNSDLDTIMLKFQFEPTTKQIKDEWQKITDREDEEKIKKAERQARKKEIEKIKMNIELIEEYIDISKDSP
jgi:hypothetical protein